MHECPDCGEACYCDMEDHHTGELCDFDCVHQCDPAFDDEDEWDEAENEWVRDPTHYAVLRMPEGIKP